MSSLYEYLKNDRENVLQRISRTLVKKMYLHPQYHKDAEHECILAWLEAEYSPFYDNESIIAYAYHCARMRLAEWRRKTLLVAVTARRENPEPIGVSLEELFGEILEIFNEETEAPDSFDILVKEQEQKEQDETELDPFDEIIYPVDDKNKKRYHDVVAVLRQSDNYDLAAQELGINKRTIYRRIQDLKAVNEI